MLKFPVKIHINSGSVTAFLLKNTNLDLKVLIPKAVADYICGNSGERLTKGFPEICEKKEKIPTYITVLFDSNSSEIIDFLNKLGDKKISTVCRNIFEAKFISERYDFLADNRCFIPDEIERKAEITLSDVINKVISGENYKTTIAGLMKICGQQKRTTSFIEGTFARLLNASASITTLDGTYVSENYFKEADKETEIIICGNQGRI